MTGVIEAASAETGFAQRDEHQRTPDFFDVEHGPNLSFTSSAVTLSDQETFELAGEITAPDATMVTLLTPAGTVNK